MGPAPEGWPVPAKDYSAEVAERSMQTSLDQFALADQVGFDWVTVAEHHFAPFSLNPNPMVMAGAIDADASDKIARFIQLCDAYDIPLLFLCDTPGLMVGPEVEKTALVRHSARILTALANATTSHMTIVLRKAYGLGYYVMGGAATEPDLLLADEPTGNLDALSAERVGQQLSAFHRAGGTVLLVTHDASLAEGADTLRHLESGRLLEIDGQGPSRPR